MLFYDIVITFGDEVEKIWKQRFTVATVLWFLVRRRLPSQTLLVANACSRIDIYRHWAISLS